MNVCVYTLGCRLNQCESEAIADSFAREGFTIVEEEQEADLYVVNTCTVTSKAEQKARRMIRKFALQAPTLATGCYAQVNEDELRKLSPNVMVVPLEKKAQLLKLAAHLKAGLVSGMDIKQGCLSFNDVQAGVFDYDAASFSYHSRAYLKIQDGCDNSCAYCRVHIARGKAVTLDASQVIERAMALEQAGFSEIMLTGVNLTMYDHEGEGLGGLLEQLLPNLGSNMRLRLSSMEPDHIDDRLLKAIEDPRMQPHFHIPVQTGSEKILSRVDRHYTIAQLEEIVARLRVAKDDPFIAADIITGLPGETEQDFEQTRSFIERMDLSFLHVFPFSPRPDTPLYHAKDRVPESVRDQRAQLLRELSKVQHERYCLRQVGRQCEVILQNRKAGAWYGLSGNYLDVRVAGLPTFAKEGLMLRGHFGRLLDKNSVMEFIPDESGL